MDQSISTYPLCWPVGYPRTTRPKSPTFKVSLATARDHLLHQISLLGGSQLILSTNAQLRRDGLPLGKQGRLTDEGVAVYFVREGQQVALACDKWDSIAANVRAIGLTIEAMRGMDRWGASDLLNRLFTGFAALPAPGQTTAAIPEWCEILGISLNDSWETVKAAISVAQKQNHPDRGGSPNQWHQVRAAVQEAKKHFNQL